MVGPKCHLKLNLWNPCVEHGIVALITRIRYCLRAVWHVQPPKGQSFVESVSCALSDPANAPVNAWGGKII